ncbi:MAG: septal ring lytic transglycosylase RlpA family protein [Bacteroidota bacterium]|nr:septal ring lytic transglycosylase RlpA family protein [Bacteroidota bacterium]
MKNKYLLCLLLITILVACHRRSVPSSLPGSGKLVTETGYASFYADKFDGRKTSSGEVFRQSKLTAAHKKLPFGTMVKVTNLSNNKAVVVKVNDRGPFVHSRIIDLSKSAAKQIDMIGAGVAKVKIEYRKP